MRTFLRCFGTLIGVLAVGFLVIEYTGFNLLVLSLAPLTAGLYLKGGLSAATLLARRDDLAVAVLVVVVNTFLLREELARWAMPFSQFLVIAIIAGPCSVVLAYVFGWLIHGRRTQPEQKG